MYFLTRVSSPFLSDTDIVSNTDNSMFNYCAMEYDLQKQYVCDEDGTAGAILEKSSRGQNITRDEHLWRKRKHSEEKGNRKENLSKKLKRGKESLETASMTVMKPANVSTSVTGTGPQVPFWRGPAAART